ncbi:MAG: hypothetical protein KTR32_28850 [Granulosicoccus sp.]|nr:hypothetical protein [Granulosicoccus sp.]
MSEKSIDDQRVNEEKPKPRYKAPKLEKLNADKTQGGPFATGLEITNGPIS